MMNILSYLNFIVLALMKLVVYQYQLVMDFLFHISFSISHLFLLNKTRYHLIIFNYIIHDLEILHNFFIALTSFVYTRLGKFLPFFTVSQ
jgi:hypothetical protein